jgi:hypothetical protein
MNRTADSFSEQHPNAFQNHPEIIWLPEIGGMWKVDKIRGSFMQPDYW